MASLVGMEGELVEVNAAQSIYRSPQHDYTRELLAAGLASMILFQLVVKGDWPEHPLGIFDETHVPILALDAAEIARLTGRDY